MQQKSAPLSQTQLGIYFECMRMNDKLAYNRHYLFTLDNSIDMERLAGAIERVVAAHPYINVRIAEVDGEPRQILEHVEKYQQKVLKMTEAEWQETLPRLLAEPLELIGGRLFKFDLVETEKAKYFLRTAHHIVFDGTAYKVLFNDIAMAYEGKEIVSESYDSIDFANDETLLRNQEAFKEAKTWYEKNFSGIDIESLPIPDLEDTSVNYENYSYTFDLEYSEIREYCKKNNINASALTYGAFGYLLGVYTAQQEMLFSTIYHGRKDDKVKNNIGMYVKTMPVYLKWQKDTKITDLLAELTEQIKGTRTHDIYSFIDLNKICNMNNKPLFAYHGTINTISKFCGKPCINERLDKNTTGGTLEVELMSVANGMEIYVEYDGSKYSAQFINIFAKCYENVLRQFLSKELISEVEVIDSEQQVLLDSFNNTNVDYDVSQTVVSLFNQAAANYPDNTAVIFEDKKLTYRDVDKLSNDIAAYILSKNIGIGDVASILIPRCEFMPITALGALKAGCAYQPLDSTYPPERLNFMIKDSDAKILITTKELKPLINDYNGAVLFIDEIPHVENFSPNYVNSPDDTFILLYTSGSTGVPKGVKLTHKNLVCFLNWYKKFYNLTAENCIGAYASFGFDANMLDTYPALTSGAALCIVPEEMRLDLAEMNNYFDSNKVTHAFMTTQVGRQFATDIDNHSLKYLSVGGEKLVTLDPPKNFSLINAYGPTECTIFITVGKVEKAEKNIPIGKALDNVKLYIVDTNGHRVPIGACGELWAAGPHVGAGYLNRPEKTAEVFIKNPFDDGKYENVYKTGDIVRYRADGNIEFIGRRDGQVKIRGFRIELSEVEAIIREFNGVKDATVAAFDNPSGGKFIVAYIVSDSKINIEELNQFISERKPPYMIPTVTMQIDKIPLNQNGKVNRRMLPKPEIQTTAEDNSKVNLNILEKALVELIGETIGIKRFGIATELNYLGLSSISAIKLATKIYKKFGISIAVKDLLGGTVESIENVLIGNWMSGQGIKQEKVSATAVKSAKISGIQKGIYLECMKNPFSTTYNVPFIYNFEVDMNIDDLISAVKNIVKSHKSVNIHFELQDDEIMQVVNSKMEVDIPVKNAVESQFSELKNNFVQPFKLSVEPLYRFMIVKTEKRVSLFADFHHLIFDGASANLFLSNLKTLLEGNSIELEKFTYFDYVAEENALIERNKQFFADMLKDFESASEVTSNAKNSAEEIKIYEQPLNLELINNYCNNNHITPAALCLAVLGYVTARYTANRNVYLTTISSGRQNVKYSDTFGMFVNTLPLKIEIADTSIKNFIEATAKMFNETIEHENYPFSQIAEDYGFNSKIMYEYQRGVIDKIDIPKFIGIEKFDHEVSKFKLIVRIIDKDCEPYISIEYNTLDYSDNLIKSFADSFSIVMKKFTEQNNQPVRKVSLIDEKRAEILAKFHSNTNPATVGKVYNYFHEGFEEQATNNPDNIALIASDCTLTYGELNEMANRIANALIEKGVKPKGRIALLLPRNSREIIAMFGVIKAGCAFIPCDIKYPAERIKQILEDSAAPYVITTTDRITSEKFIDV